MAGTKPNEPCLIEDSYKLDIVLGENRKHRLDRVLGLHRSSMANECPEVDIVSAQRIADLDVQGFFHQAFSLQLFVVVHLICRSQLYQRPSNPIVTFS